MQFSQKFAQEAAVLESVGQNIAASQRCPEYPNVTKVFACRMLFMVVLGKPKTAQLETLDTGNVTKEI